MAVACWHASTTGHTSTLYTDRTNGKDRGATNQLTLVNWFVAPVDMSNSNYYIAYYRVSTQRQAGSGLGLEAQRHAVAALVRQRGGELVEEFTEVESGRKTDKDRPALASAISRARRQKATLVVARLDRLARNVSFMAVLMDSGLEFVACDNPYANRLTVHIMSAIAEHERRIISQRTKDALAEAKKRGTALGSARPGHWTGREGLRLKALAQARARSLDAIQRNAVEAYRDLEPRLRELVTDGMSARAIAKILQLERIPARRSERWSGTQVARVLRRLGIAPGAVSVGSCSTQ